jgi:hypothetical protein
MPSLWSSRLSLVRSLSRPWTSMPSLWSSLSSVVLPSRRRLVFVCLRLVSVCLRLLLHVYRRGGNMARPSPLETTETRWRRRDTRTCSLFRVPRVAHVQPLLCPSRRARAASVAPSVSVPSRSFHPPSSRTPLPPLTRTSRLPPPPFLGQRRTRGWAGRCWGTSCRCSRPSSSPPPTPCRPAGARRRWRSCWTRSRCVWATGQGTRAWGRGPGDAGRLTRNR